MEAFLGLAIALLRFSSRREIPRDLAEAAELAVRIAQGGDDHIGPEATAVFANTPPFVLHPTELGCLAQLLGGLAAGDVLGWKELRKVLTDDFRGGIALDLLGA